MTSGSAHEFLDRVATDPRYRETIEKAMEGTGNPAREILALATEAGFQVTEEDLQRALLSWSGRDVELSAEELASVAGGFNPQPDPPKVLSSLTNVFVRPGAIKGIVPCV